MILMILSLVILVLAIVFSICNILYKRFGLLKCIFHDKLGWHEPGIEREFDGCNIHSVCKHCGKEIMIDSQGNWTEGSGEL